MKKYKPGGLFVLWLLFLCPNHALSQTDSVLNHKKIGQFAVVSTSAYVLTLVGLNELWYKEFPREKFHFFDDSKEWKQMDKVGHAYTSFHLGKTAFHALRNAGLTTKKSYIWGSVVGILFMTPIEIMDGYSSEYGASVSDMVFNVGGALMFAAQGMVWDEIRVRPKFSFSRSGLAYLRPTLLGGSWNQEILKDYNGQTYWLSFDVHKFLKKDNKFPKWLNLSVGYGAHNMIHASDVANADAGYNSYRQFYISPDVDFSHVKTKSNALKTLLFMVGMIHLPVPTFEYNEVSGAKWHWFFF